MLKTWAAVLISLAVLAGAFQNCSKRVSEPEQPFPLSTAAHYFRSTETLTVEVYYEPGAEPYSGTTTRGRYYWQILEENLESIFQFRSVPPQLSVPRTIAEMNAIPIQNRTEWTTTDMLALHEQHHQAKPTFAHARFYIYFVRGHYSTGNGPQTGTIGVNIGGTPVMFLFKEVIQNSGFTALSPVPKFVEQSTLVHEMGHALGFVNLGVPMKDPHEDGEHQGHTLNADCVMFWKNEGFADMSQFIQKYLNSASVIMWGPEVLADAQAFSR